MSIQIKEGAKKFFKRFIILYIIALHLLALYYSPYLEIVEDETTILITLFENTILLSTD